MNRRDVHAGHIPGRRRRHPRPARTSSGRGKIAAGLRARPELEAHADETGNVKRALLSLISSRPVPTN